MKWFILISVFLMFACGENSFPGNSGNPTYPIPPQECHTGDLANTWEQVGGVHDGNLLTFESNCIGHDEACGLVFTYQKGGFLQLHVTEVSGDPECLVTAPGNYNCDIILPYNDAQNPEAELSIDCGNNTFFFKKAQ